MSHTGIPTHLYKLCCRCWAHSQENSHTQMSQWCYCMSAYSHQCSMSTHPNLEENFIKFQEFFKLSTCSVLACIPSQEWLLFPRWYPMSQLQEYDPIVLWQSWAHPLMPSLHSSISNIVKHVWIFVPKISLSYLCNCVYQKWVYIQHNRSIHKTQWCLSIVDCSHLYSPGIHQYLSRFWYTAIFLSC